MAISFSDYEIPLNQMSLELHPQNFGSEVELDAPQLLSFWEDQAGRIWCKYNTSINGEFKDFLVYIDHGSVFRATSKTTRFPISMKQAFEASHMVIDITGQITNYSAAAYVSGTFQTFAELVAGIEDWEDKFPKELGYLQYEQYQRVRDQMMVQGVK